MNSICHLPIQHLPLHHMADELTGLEGLVSVQDQSAVESIVISEATANAKERIITSLTTKLAKMDKRIAKETETLNKILDKDRAGKSDKNRIEALQGIFVFIDYREDSDVESGEKGHY